MQKLVLVDVNGKGSDDEDYSISTHFIYEAIEYWLKRNDFDGELEVYPCVVRKDGTVLVGSWQTEELGLLELGKEDTKGGVI